MKLFSRLMVGLTVLLANIAFAEDQFSFSELSSGKNLSMEELKSNQMILFWRSDCAPCRIEMGFLPDIAKEHPDLKIALVALEAKTSAQKYLLKNLPENVKTVLAENNLSAVLKKFGDSKAALPFSVMLHKDGTTCETNDGILGTKKINHWVKIC